jgi:tetratricopeptide (TPR) repeat protein
MKRPIQHIQETESRKAFESIIPNEWVYRPFSSDYGIDYQIEIFLNKESTGKEFYVQLKSSNQKVENNSVKITLDRKQLEYFQARPLPVLLVVYSTTVKMFYGIWTNSYLSIHKMNKSSKSVQIKFNINNLISRQFFEKLQNSFCMDIFRKVGVSFCKIKGKDSNLFIDVLKKWIDFCFHDSIYFDNGSLPKQILIKVKNTKDRKYIELVDNQLGSFSTEVTLKNKYFINFPILDLASIPSEFYEILFLFSIFLIDCDTQKSAILIAKIFPFYNGKYKKIENIFHIAKKLLKKHAIKEFQDIVISCIDNQNWDNFQWFNLILIFWNKKNFKDEYRQICQNNLELAIKKTNDTKLKGMFYYNLANSKRGESPLHDVFHHYLEAKRYEPDYLKRSYWWEEIGGILFLSRHYNCSASCYKKAYTLSKEVRKDNLALTADALFMAGKFKESIKLFEDYFKEQSIENSEWMVKHMMASEILKIGLGKNTINKEEAIKKVSHALEIRKTDRVSFELMIQEALELDPLCGLAWFNYAVFKNEIGNTHNALFGFLLSALINEWDKASWIAALFLSMKDDTRLAYYIADMMLFKFKKDILNMVAKFIDLQPNLNQKGKRKAFADISQIFKVINDKKMVTD